MVDFSSQHKAVVLLEEDYLKFVAWAAENEVSFQQIKTEHDADEIHGWLPSTEEEWEPSWEDSNC